VVSHLDPPGENTVIIKIIIASRYLILIPIIGLTITASAMFLFGGIGLLAFLWNVIIRGVETQESIIIVVEFIHFFLIGTVLYLTALGFYQLFIQEIDLPAWLKIHSTDELETNLIGVSVVVLAVDFLGIAITRGHEDLLNYGAGIALPIAALSLFLWARAYGSKKHRPDDN
jgi:uncharacterized membrane protein YqhA